MLFFEIKLELRSVKSYIFESVMSVFALVTVSYGALMTQSSSPDYKGLWFYTLLFYSLGWCVCLLDFRKHKSFLGKTVLILCLFLTLPLIEMTFRVLFSIRLF